MGVCGSQLARERNEFHNRQLQDKDEIISELKEKKKTLEDEKKTLELNEIKKDTQLEQKNEQLKELRSENDTLKAKIKKSPTVSESVGNIAKQTGELVGAYMGFKK